MKKEGGGERPRSRPQRVNHTKLLFSTVSKYEDARQQYCQKVIGGEFAVVRDDATLKELPVGDQRVYVTPHKQPAPAAPPGGRDERCGGRRRHPPDAAAGDVAASGSAASGSAASSSAAGDAAGGAGAAAESPRVPDTNMLTLLAQVVGTPAEKCAPLFIRANNKPEHDMLHNQALYVLTSMLKDGGRAGGGASFNQVPISLPMSRLAEQTRTSGCRRERPSSRLSSRTTPAQPTCCARPSSCARS